MKKIVGIALAIIMCAGTAFAAPAKAKGTKTDAKKTEQTESSSKRIYLKLGIGCGGIVAPTSDESLNDQLDDAYGFDVYGTYYASSMFDIHPAIGFYPISKNENFSLELSVLMNSGNINCSYSSSSSSNGTTSMTYISFVSYDCTMPIISAQYFFTPKEKFSFFTGAGFGLPFQKVSALEYKASIVGFDVVLNYGAQFKIINNLNLFVECTVGIGSFLGVSAAGGIRYAF